MAVSGDQGIMRRAVGREAISRVWLQLLRAILHSWLKVDLLAWTTYGLQECLVGEKAWRIVVKHMFTEDVLRKKSTDIYSLASRCPYSKLEEQCLQRLWKVKSGRDTMFGTRLLLKNKVVPEWIAARLLGEMTQMAGSTPADK